MKSTPAGFRRHYGFVVPTSFNPTPHPKEKGDWFYLGIIRLARRYMQAQGLEITVEGAENYPSNGGAMIVVNHTGYFDFVYAGIPAYLNGGRLVRFMAKTEIFENKIAGPLMRKMKHIPVDRHAGADSMKIAIERLRLGQLVGIFPEATISRSFELKDFKTGAARIARDAGVPLIPVTIFGSQRVWTKGGKKHLGRCPVPVWIRVGEAIAPGSDAVESTKQLHSAMEAQYDQLKQDYIERYGAFEPGLEWMPQRLGGSAPTKELADQQDAEERERKRLAREEKKAKLAQKKSRKK
ncbi:1-acyl-sn-glycerol-3-phosphate acyltransferase [Corynebacterium sp. TAE3-ERU12]|uniref:lysophospholipid acyltransferase family protein n=1 Tax=Corynebacterium sp. TAE3-ERU12 TaxID=2849491 RepID=UPI001C440FA7|nr:lysophospholipid acyltransferase family protein [Corynebacterium sp. TAE3-ERU12]MBV7296077.1 1-acyl-sn-glycerol-3-phosphate acyltransferase [Corynebacterium sp. TAE3-ERU12]